MSILQLLWRNLLYRKALSLLTVFSIALTVALVVLLMLMNAGVEKGAENGYGPFELVIGADGSKTQLALNTFYHVGTPTGNVPYEVFESVREEGQTDAAFAMTAGDNLNGFPIVGIDADYFQTRYGDRRMASGKLYGQTGEAVLGAYVAKALGLKPGDTFHGGHGLVDEGEHRDEEAEEAGHAEHGGQDEHKSFQYRVVGILPPLHTADDRAVFTTLDYAWAVHKSQEGARKDVTAVMVKPKSLLGAQALKLKYDKLDNVQAVYTSKAVADVVNMLDKGGQAVAAITGLCVVLAGISLLLSLVAAVNERQKDVGLLRLIGKTRSFVLLSLIGEGMLLTGIGLLLGLLLGHAGGYFGVDMLFAFAGVQIDALRFATAEWQLVCGTLLLGLLASAGPAMRVYRVDPLQLFRG